MSSTATSTRPATSVIELQGVRVHNLKNINLQIKRNALTVICGVSGSGKSSLAFDTLFAEGQRRYVETFSPYARQFLDRVERPDVDRIDGIPPAIAIRQNARGQSSRSTIGTRTEVLDYLRVLFAKAGQITCPDCSQPAVSMSPDHASRHLLQVAAGRRAMLVFDAGSEVTPEEYVQRGYSRGIVAGMTQPLESLNGDTVAGLRIVVDRIRIDEASAERIAESIEQAFEQGDGTCCALIENQVDTGTAVEVVDDKSWMPVTLSRQLSCLNCGRRFETPTAESLNFLSPLGACTTCEGFGQISGMTFEKVVPDDSISLRDGAIQPWTTPAYRHELDELLELAPDFGISCDVPFAQLTATQKQRIHDGIPERDFGGLAGFHRWLVRNRYKQGVSVFLNRWRSWLPCPQCNGTRLNSSASAIQLGNLTVTQTSEMELDELRTWLEDSLTTVPQDLQASLSAVIQQLRTRLQFLVDSGLGYLSLARSMRTLSGGEAQRVVLTAALGSGLINTLYVLDEPTSGLHASDTAKVITAAKRLQGPGNTVVVVEHDPDFICAADEVVEIGPGAGEAGGTVVFQGTPQEMMAKGDSATGRLLATMESCDDDRFAEFPTNGMSTTLEGDRTKIAGQAPCRSPEKWLTFRDLSCHNIQLLSGQIPLGVICAITGVSGSGKSSLVVDTLYPALRRKLGLPVDSDGQGSVQSLDGVDAISDVVLLDQSPLPRSRRSIPVTVMSCFDDIRKVMAETHEAKKRNYKPGMFSFNSAKGGRCEVCEGHGVVTVEMQFLADIQTTCEACSGRRFRPEVLEVRYRDRSIHDILQMTAEEAFTFFNGHRRIQQRLNALRQAGLGYIRLGQPVATLSGGECQRLRIAALLAGVAFDSHEPLVANRKSTQAGSTLFILDEPSTGLHMQDIESLMKCLNHLVEIGHSIIVIEHDAGVIRHADYVIEMGPGPGRLGGRIMRQTGGEN